MEHKQSNDITYETMLEVYEKLINIVKEYETYMEQERTEEPYSSEKLRGCISLMESLKNIRDEMIEQQNGEK